MNKELKAYLAKIGSKGGKVSRRKLTTEQAQAMAKKSAAKRKMHLTKPHSHRAG